MKVSKQLLPSSASTSTPISTLAEVSLILGFIFPPTRRGPNRAAASGRLRADRPGARWTGRADRTGACADQYSKQQFYNTIYFNTFMKHFFNVQIPSIFFSVFLQISHQDNLLHNNLFCLFHLQKHPSPLLNLPKQCKICQVVVPFQCEALDIDL